MVDQAIIQLDDSSKDHRRSHIPFLTPQVERAGLKKIASGKVRELYDLDATSLLFVATDRLSAYDIVLDNVRAPVSLVPDTVV